MSKPCPRTRKMDEHRFSDAVNVAIAEVRAAKMRINATHRAQIETAAVAEQARIDAHRAKDDYYAALQTLEDALGAPDDIDPSQMELKDDSQSPDRRPRGPFATARSANVARAWLEDRER